MPRRVPSLALLALLAIGGAAAWARDTGGPGGPVPEKNFSNIHADVDWVVKAFRDAESAAAEGHWGLAARTLQGVIDATHSREAPANAAPYVRPVWGTTVYEGAWIVARHRLAAWGADALRAYEGEFGATARTQLERASDRRDEAMLADVAARYLGLAAGRRAALLLADLALEAGDRDAALQWLQALEDLEAVSAEPEEALAPWREARIRRHARALARDESVVGEVRAALAGARPQDGPESDVVAAALRRPEPAARTWPTTGGNAARSALPPALGTRFVLRWFKGPDRDEDLVDSRDPQHDERDRPSVWLPPRAVATAEHLFVNDGEFVHTYDLETGRRAHDREAGRHPGARRGGIGEDNSQDRRLRFGLLEGHALTLHPVRDLSRPGPGHLLLAAVPDGNPTWPWRMRHMQPGQSRRDDHIQAWHWDGTTLRALWRIGGYRGAEREGGLLPDTRLYGAPVVYRDRVWVAGVRPAKATSDRWEAWLFSFDPRSGRVLTRTHLGTGTPVRAGRVDEVVPSSVAARRGRVVVGTALGMLAAVDARDGRVQWIYRYDRAVETERGRRRNREARDDGLRSTSFANEPPVLALDRCYVTPTDSNQVLMLFDRPRTAQRTMECDAADRLTASPDFLVEHIAGVAPGGDGVARLVLVGKGESSSPPGPIVAALDARSQFLDWPDLDERAGRRPIWAEHSPTGFGPDPYGRALVTAEEVFVPTRYGIAIYELVDRDDDGSHYLGMLGTKDVPEALRDVAPDAPYGNLIPLPGRGLVAVSATTIAYWEQR